MAKFGQKILTLGLQSGIDPEHLYDFNLRPEKVSPALRPKIQKLLAMSDYIRNEIAVANAKKQLSIHTLLGNVPKYLPSFLRHGKQNFIVPMAWETPKTLFERYYCCCFFICEDFINLESLIDLDVHFIFLNPPQTQNIFDEINSPTIDDCVYLAIKLLSFHNPFYPFKVIIY